MTPAPDLSPFDQARGLIADVVLGADPVATDGQLGDITLRPHQRQAVGRVRSMLTRHGGAMLADHVGLGKTYVALGVSTRYRAVLVVAPAALREMWNGAAHRAGRLVTFLTTQSLSRRGAPRDLAPPDLVIVDEAHHLRSHLTNRYAALATLCQRAHVLLLSATPVQNRRDDLLAQLALFLGSRVASLTDAQLAEYIVRREHDATDGSIPALSGPHPLTVPVEDDVLDEILALPPPFPAADEGVAGALAAYSLVHLWASSRAALVQSVRRRRARAHAMHDALLAGRIPTRRELTAWAFDGGALQLAFTELVLDAPADTGVEPQLAHVDRYIAATTALLDRVRSSPDPDRWRASLLEELLDRHHGERIVVFSQYAETVAAVAAPLRRRGGIAVLTARGGQIASGAISRAEILSQFDPGDRRSRSVAIAERIDMLITTDVLSEGVNLHAASVAVHLDLPWNPARMEQRVGRVRRLGSPHAEVCVYALLPPAPAEQMLRVEQRLRGKLEIARETIGAVRLTLPDVVTTEAQVPADRSAPEAMERIRQAMSRWPRGAVSMSGGFPFIVGVVGDPPGLLGVVYVDGERHLIGATTEALSPDPRLLEPLVHRAHGPQVPLDLDAIRATTRRFEDWIQERRGKTMAGVTGQQPRDSRGRVLARIATACRAAPRHRRPAIAALAGHARSAMARRLNVGAERVLLELADAPMESEEWLRSVAAFGALPDDRTDEITPDITKDHLIAAIVFVEQERTNHVR